MAKVIFYEKPGCSGNARQKALLQDSGHTLVVRDLLRTSWTAETLKSFFGDMPVAQWFNRNAPLITSGKLDPKAFDAPTALALLVEQPILIRRPLLEVKGERRAGFDPVAIAAWIDLSAGTAGRDDYETCRQVVDPAHVCQGHDEGLAHAAHPGK